MKPLLSQCLIGYKFGRVNVDKDYFLCCRIPPIGNFNEDGTYKEFWNSEKLDLCLAGGGTRTWWGQKYSAVGGHNIKPCPKLT